MFFYMLYHNASNSRQDATAKLNVSEFYNDRKWNCFGCIHVQSATVLLGMWHLALHVTGILMIATMIINPQFISIGIKKDDSLNSAIGTTEEMPLFPIEDSFSSDAPPVAMSDVKEFFYEDGCNGDEELKLWVTLTFISLVTTLMVMYGAVCSKPTFIIPFFCLQLFDFLITISVIFAYTFFVTDISQIFKPFSKIPLPFHHIYARIDTIQIQFLAFSVMIFSIVIKMYLLNVVWRCYKFLMTRRLICIHGLYYVNDENVSPTVEDAEADLKDFPPPPPSYDDIMANEESVSNEVLPPRYNAV